MMASGMLDDGAHDPRLQREIDEQRLSNETALPFSAEYGAHRDKVMHQLLKRAGPSGRLSLCLLGAGNCYDVDLAVLAAHYASVHLVDIDRAAVERAHAELSTELARKVVIHAPVDLTGMIVHLPEWSRYRLTAETLIYHPQKVAKDIVSRVQGPFDVVASACVLTQMQLAVLNALGEEHRLFQAVRHTLSVTHFRTLAELTRVGGQAVLLTDVVSADRLTLAEHPSPAEVTQSFESAVQQGNVIYVAHPELLRLTLADDPSLKQQLSAGVVDDVWLWQQGPRRRFITYALVLDRCKAPNE